VIALRYSGVEWVDLSRKLEIGELVSQVGPVTACSKIHNAYLIELTRPVRSFSTRSRGSHTTIRHSLEI
jgi:hypothetical protein